ncbi:hypothetical protein VTI74DRAFT_1333 [Chaetomium olivicolor]
MRETCGPLLRSRASLPPLPSLLPLTCPNGGAKPGIRIPTDSTWVDQISSLRSLSQRTCGTGGDTIYEHAPSEQNLRVASTLDLRPFGCVFRRTPLSLLSNSRPAKAK